MTKEQAIRLMEQGKKVTHRYFSPKEFATIKNGQIVTEEGYSVPMKEFWAYRNTESWNDGWEEFVESKAIPSPVSGSLRENLENLFYSVSTSTGGRALSTEICENLADEVLKLLPLPSPGDNQSLEDAAKAAAQQSWNKRKDRGETENASAIDYIVGYVDGFLVGAAHSFNKESFLTALRDSNPYPEPDSNDKAWNECFNKVIELLNQKEAK